MQVKKFFTMQYIFVRSFLVQCFISSTQAKQTSGILMRNLPCAFEEFGRTLASIVYPLLPGKHGQFRLTTADFNMEGLPGQHSRDVRTFDENVCVRIDGIGKRTGVEKKQAQRRQR